jgi:hypothetical protein
MDGDRYGAYYEKLLRDGATSFYVIIRPHPFMTERDVSLIERGDFTIEELHPEIARLGRRPKPGTHWTYLLESFEVDREHHADSELFADHAKNYESQVFDDFETLMKHCRDKFQIAEGDFKKSWKTNYPPR